MLEDGSTGLIFAANAENITIKGPGTIDGQGAHFLSPAKELPSPAGSDHPYHRRFYQCKNLRVRGLFLKDSAFHSPWISHEYLRVQLPDLRKPWLSHQDTLRSLLAF
jgi:hypothetical protein